MRAAPRPPTSSSPKVIRGGGRKAAAPLLRRSPSIIRPKKNPPAATPTVISRPGNSAPRWSSSRRPPNPLTMTPRPPVCAPFAWRRKKKTKRPRRLRPRQPRRPSPRPRSEADPAVFGNAVHFQIVADEVKPVSRDTRPSAPNSPRPARHRSPPKCNASPAATRPWSAHGRNRPPGHWPAACRWWCPR